MGEDLVGRAVPWAMVAHPCAASFSSGVPSDCRAKARIGRPASPQEFFHVSVSLPGPGAEESYQRTSFP